MRRNVRRSREDKKNYNVLYIVGSVFALGIIAFAITFIVYGNYMDEQADLSSQKIASLVQEATKETTEASTEIGKTVEESKNEMQNSVDNTVVEIQNNVTANTNTVQNDIKEETINTVQTKKTTTTEENSSNVITFIKPVAGEIIKDYAKDKLIYSDTLEEWTTHLGWDIEADKTTVVKASEEGTIKSIKNDPRYGLSIVIEHQDGYQTLYANLLSTEFVSVGEEVKQGQSIGTVGNTAMFEIADETHLHFEITKDGENIDPNTIVKN